MIVGLIHLKSSRSMRAMHRDPDLLRGRRHGELVVPIASVMALISAGGEPIAPASPQPLTPSGLLGQGVFEVVTVNEGRSSARGIA